MQIFFTLYYFVLHQVLRCVYSVYIVFSYFASINNSNFGEI